MSSTPHQRALQQGQARLSQESKQIGKEFYFFVFGAVICALVTGAFLEFLPLHEALLPSFISGGLTAVFIIFASGMGQNWWENRTHRERLRGWRQEERH